MKELPLKYIYERKHNGMILERLRSETQNNHKKLEESPLLTLLTSKNITIPAYIEILKKFYGFFNPLELLLNQTTGFSFLFSDYDERRKTNLILRDLRTLNAENQTFLTCDDIPKINSQAQALGVLYVMEGSTLGGRMISKMLKENLGLESESGAAFFNGYGAQTMQKWNSFKEILEEYCIKNGCEEEIVSTADATFLKFNYWMNK